MNSLVKVAKKLYYHLPIKKNILVDFYHRHLHGIYRLRTIPSKAGVEYIMNDEKGLINLKVREDRAAEGRDFEYKDMIATNKAIGVNFITPDIKTVVNIGSGVGTFEFVNSQLHPGIFFLASEMDESQTKWAIENRSFSNVKYCTDSMDKILSAHSKFDLAVTVDVIEHVKDYKGFLEDFSQLADKAVIATPNRDRSFRQIKQPTYKYHVQEFNAGELFFILKMFYNNVKIFSAPDSIKTDLIPVGFYSTYNKLFAYCER